MATTTVHSLFSCVASRNRERMKRHPAPGNRNGGSGALWYVGNDGYCWASSFTSTNAYRLYFYYGGIFPNRNNNRATGLPLRCLQE